MARSKGGVERVASDFGDVEAIGPSGKLVCGAHIGTIVITIIKHYGDEVLKVLEVS